MMSLLREIMLSPLAFGGGRYIKTDSLLALTASMTVCTFVTVLLKS